MDKFEIGDKVSVKGYTHGVVFDIFDNNCYVVHLETGFVCYVSPDNLTKVEDKGMSKFEIGDEVIITDMSNHVIQECLGKSGRIIDVPSCDKYYTVYCDYVLLRLKENQIEAKGMSEFKVGDVVKFNNNGLFYKIVYLSKESVITSKLNDTDNKITSKQEISFGVNSFLYFGMELATDGWRAYQEKQKAKEESKAVVSLLKELAGQIENGEVSVFTEEFDYSKTRVVGGNVVSLKFEGISK